MKCKLHCSIIFSNKQKKKNYDAKLQKYFKDFDIRETSSWSLAQPYWFQAGKSQPKIFREEIFISGCARSNSSIMRQRKIIKCRKERWQDLGYTERTLVALLGHVCQAEGVAIKELFGDWSRFARPERSFSISIFSKKRPKTRRWWLQNCSSDWSVSFYRHRHGGSGPRDKKKKRKKKKKKKKWQGQKRRSKTK